MRRRRSRRCVVLLDLEPLEVNLFRGRARETPHQRVFGGQVLAQALVAAGPHRRPPSAGCTRCTRTSCGPATRRSRSSTTSTASVTAGASPPAAWSRSSTARRSSTSRRRSTSPSPGPTTRPDARRPATRRPPRRAGAGGRRRARDRVAVGGRSGRSRCASSGGDPWSADGAARTGPGPVVARRDRDVPDDPLLHACVVAYVLGHLAPRHRHPAAREPGSTRAS